MKFKLVLVVLSLFTFLTSCKDAVKEEKFDGYVISGTVKGIDNVYIKMYEYTFFNQDKARFIDSTLVKNGVFNFKGKVEFPDMAFVQIGEFMGNFFLENSAIEIAIDVSDLKGRNIRFEPVVKGSKSHDELKRIRKQSRSVFEKGMYPALDEFNVLAKEVYASKDSLKLVDLNNKREELAPLFEKRMNEFKAVIYNYVRQNPSSTLSPHVLSVNYSEGRMSKELLKEFYNVLEGDARKTGFFKNYIAKIYKDNFENLGVGNIAPDFTLNTVKGESLTLSKVEGKYLLVDFWASWCAPCRASFPHLKELRKQYKKDGFTIVGIGTADVEDKWRKAIKEDQTPWIHVFDASESRSYGPVAVSYGVPHLPTTFLMDSNQKIILRNPTKEELDAKLKELFGH